MTRNQSSSDREQRIAMLIDGDNAQYSVLKQMIEEVSRYGEITIRRAFGDWTQPNLANWRPVMLAHAIQPVQQWRYTAGKNATDSALIIDAMDILYSGNVDGFCIVSSDSDYTRLGTRIRESGLFVMGIGRSNTPEAFIKACNVFVFVENLMPPAEVEGDVVKALVAAEVSSATRKPATVQVPAAVNPAAVKPAAAQSARKPAKKTVPAKKAAVPAADDPALAAANTNAALQVVDVLRRAFDISPQDDEGWAKLSMLGDALQRIEPSFDSRTFGYKSLSLLIKSMPEHFEVKGAKTTGASTIYVRLKSDA